MIDEPRNERTMIYEPLTINKKIMIEPFDIEIGELTYAVFPEEDEMYTIFKDGIEYVKIQKDTEGIWLKLDPETEMPLFGVDEEINNIGKAIILYQENGGGDEDEEDDDEEEEFQ